MRHDDARLLFPVQPGDLLAMFKRDTGKIIVGPFLIVAVSDPEPTHVGSYQNVWIIDETRFMEKQTMYDSYDDSEVVLATMARVT